MKRIATLTLSVLAVVTGLAVGQAKVNAQGLPDLVPTNLRQWGVTTRLGGPTLEFGILTANIGGQDYIRFRDPVTGQWRMPQIYQYDLYYWNPDLPGEGGGNWQVPAIATNRKNTICTIDSLVRFSCIQEHGFRFGCGSFQGVSRGFADDYSRGLTGQWVSFAGYPPGYYGLHAILDPDGHMQIPGTPDSGRDANPDNNWAFTVFFWEGIGAIPDSNTYTYLSFADPCTPGAAEQAGTLSLGAEKVASFRKLGCKSSRGLIGAAD